MIPSFTAAGVGNVASYQAGEVAPGEAVVIFGENFGAVPAVTKPLVADDALYTEIGSTRVLFDGVPGAMIYSVQNQLSVLVPYAVAGKASTHVQIEYNGIRSAPVTVPVKDAVPGLFTMGNTGKGQGAFFNQDHSENGPANPAMRGSTILMFGTGEGQTNPAGQDGKLSLDLPIPKPVLPVKVKIGGMTVNPAYAGGAPDLTAGLLQVNVKIPKDSPTGNAVPISIVVGDKESRGVTVAIK